MITTPLPSINTSGMVVEATHYSCSLLPVTCTDVLSFIRQRHLLPSLTFIRRQLVFFFRRQRFICSQPINFHLTSWCCAGCKWQMQTKREAYRFVTDRIGSSSHCAVMWRKQAFVILIRDAKKKRKLSGKYKIKKGNEYMSFSSPVFCLQTIMNKKKNQEFDHVYSLDIIKGHYEVLEKKFKSSILMR